MFLAFTRELAIDVFVKYQRIVLLILLLAALNLRAKDAGVETNMVAKSVQPLHANGVQNFFQLGKEIYSGSAPEGDAGFAALKALGIKTIITVDGAKPDVERARRFGIRYVHLPIGYDGVPTSQAVRLVKAVETLQGPFYMHCHHGMHRGPAAAAVVCMATEGWTADEGVAWLKLAGTATNYPGLYKSVETFHPPTAAALTKVSSDFPDKSTISPLADTMVQIDERFDHVKLIKKAGYIRPADQPDLQPANETLLLDELFKELLRSPEVSNRPADFKTKLQEAQAAADAFHQSVVSELPDFKKMDANFQRISDACAACHKSYRN